MKTKKTVTLSLKERDLISDGYFKLIDKFRDKKDEHDCYALYLTFCIGGAMLIKMIGIKKVEEVFLEIKEKANQDD